MEKTAFLRQLGIGESNLGVHTGVDSFGSHTKHLASFSPVDGAKIGSVALASLEDYERLVRLAQDAFVKWRAVPAPKRGEIVRLIGNALREHKDALGALVSYEMGKSLQEGKGEVQEMIDICDFAVGLSRQLYGLSMHSERPSHRMYEQWHPIGLVGIISAFNFPVAVWSWNSMIAMVCGDVSIWKPSEKTPLSAIACMNIISKVLAANQVPEGVLSLIVGDVDPIGKAMVDDARIPLISATGSTAMGKVVGAKVAARLGRSILELGGNNAIIVSPHANFDLSLPAIVFGAVGTAGQRCTTTRRVFIHSSCYDRVKDALLRAYQALKIGNPLDEAMHLGPLIDEAAVDAMQKALTKIKEHGGKVLFGGERLSGANYPSKCYVRPALVEADHKNPMTHEETFAPILYLMRYDNLSDAIAMQNDVKQGLSSALFTDNLCEAEDFLSASGSDCGIANINIGTSGAEIGGAFGGEKDTGGGRESGSDSWKAYMRRQTNTINYGKSLPLAQGIRFTL